MEIFNKSRIYFCGGRGNSDFEGNIFQKSQMTQAVLNINPIFLTFDDHDRSQVSLWNIGHRRVCSRKIYLFFCFCFLSFILKVNLVFSLYQGNATTTNQRSLVLIVAKLTLVMGITWILGFLLAFYPTPYIEYPFIIVSSCQGKMTFKWFSARRIFFFFSYLNFKFNLPVKNFTSKRGLSRKGVLVLCEIPKKPW